MNAQRAAQIAPALQYLQACNITLHELLLSVLVHGYCNDPASRFYSDLVNNTESVLSAFHDHHATTFKTQEWSRKLVVARCSDALQDLTSSAHGWQFSAMHARPEQIQDFKIEEMAAEITRTAPELWCLVRTLLGGSKAREEDMPSEEAAEEMDIDDEALWDMVGDLPGEEGLNTDGSGARLGKRAQGRLRELRGALINVKAVVIISILMMMIWTPDGRKRRGIQKLCQGSIALPETWATAERLQRPGSNNFYTRQGELRRRVAGRHDEDISRVLRRALTLL
ncbi:hypothetical protein OH76DRAFT_1476758 [Lentinus brumalis]|uniref:Uncharacterized protein n=1 Tax=Lentinus brumalis TaxID=2498619 RepID=A0A371DXS7_9APHY|nr:hypothetical protein OH76DRAFT_1476758 [Polyporus brumalis]